MTLFIHLRGLIAREQPAPDRLSPPNVPAGTPLVFLLREECDPSKLVLLTYVRTSITKRAHPFTCHRVTVRSQLGGKFALRVSGRDVSGSRDQATATVTSLLNSTYTPTP